MKRFTRRSLFLLLTAALCLLLAGCWGSDPLAEENGDLNGLLGLEGSDTADDVVPITSFALPILAGETLDPIDCGDGVQQLLLPLLYEGLFELDPSFEPQPVLCESYTHSEDFMVWTFQVRSVSFSDGSALSAADVAAALQRAKTSARYGARLSSVSSIRVQNGAVEITLSQANNRFPALLDIRSHQSSARKRRAYRHRPVCIHYGGQWRILDEKHRQVEGGISTGGHNPSAHRGQREHPDLFVFFPRHSDAAY